MKAIKEQVWLTSALTDKDVPGALALCFSLRRVGTSRKIAVIISQGVSKQLREALEYSFDFVFSLQEDRNTVGLKITNFVKLFALTLKNFKICVMLTPNMLAVKNCDELFDWAEENEQQMAWTKHQDMSVILIRPSIHEYYRFLDLLKNNCNGRDNFAAILESKTKHEKYIDEKYNRSILNNSDLIVGNAEDISIVKLPVDFNKDKLETETLGLIGKMILNLWKSIHDWKVKPLLANYSKPTMILPEISSETYEGDAIAIVGMSCRYPGANNLEEFWQLLLDGKGGTGTAPEFRWRRDMLTARDTPNCRNINAGFLHYPVEEFDSKFFGISPLEMEYLDPQTRLLHELVWEGLEDAAVNPQSLRGTNGGVFLGSWMNEYKDLLTLSGDDDFYRKYMGNSIGAAAARISFLLGMTGPSIATESGCSASMVAVHLACRSLQLRETNVALACGVNLILRPFDKDTMPQVLSPDGLCKTFDAKANGFARAEGCGVLVLKRISDAVRDGDKIWALIRGSGISQEGLSQSMGTPTIHSETLAMKMALADANVRPEQVSYVEAHGTGTAVGDPMEVASIAKVYHSKQRKEPLIIGSVKTNVGHTESCSGITGIMKTVLALQHELIPRHRNFETLNPAIDLESVPAILPLETVQWKRIKGKPRYAGVSSFGITGTDAHAIIEEAPTSSSIPNNSLQGTLTERPLHLMKISAKTDEALKILLENYKQHLSTTSDDFKDLCFTANVGRADFNHRSAIIASSNQDAIQIIQTNEILMVEVPSKKINKIKICFLFTGQGSQYPGMAKQLYETNLVFRMHFEYCEKILKETYNIDISSVLWSDEKASEVSRTIYSQTSIFCVEYALLKLWESWGVKADYALGHSLGEFAAAVCANILSVEDAIKLVAERSRLIDELPRGKMLVIKANKTKVDSLMNSFSGGDKNQILDFAAINSNEQTVVAGDSELILSFSACCKRAGLKCVLLDATHAFHSKHMDPILEEYKNVAKNVKKLEGNDCKYISGVRGCLIEADEVNAEYWVQHTREKVSFWEASRKAGEVGCKIFIEIGPQPVLSALTMMNNEGQLLCLPSLRKNENEWETLLNTLAKLYLNGVEIDWKGFDQFQKRSKVRLPHYPFKGKKFWPDMSTCSGVVSMHPLLGTVIPNASSSNLFQIGLNVKQIPWVKDHSIGDHVLFPGAGYLEMCLAAGLAVVESSTESLPCPTRPMKVENLYIEAPLVLQESTSCQVQTLADLKENDEDGNDITIKIFRKDGSDLSGKWQNHAKATFSPLPTQEDKQIPSTFSHASFLETLGRKADNGSFLQQVYDRLASVGLNFGPAFKSIESIWRDEENQLLVAKVKLPSDDGFPNKYIIHPVVLDAMIQAVMMLRPLSSIKKSLYVPIKIGKFVWLSAAAPDSELYIHAVDHQDASGSSSILVDSSGTVLAVMSSIELISTTVKAVESVVEQQSNTLPELWEEVWVPTPSLLYPEIDDSSEKFFTEKFHSEFHEKYNIPSEHAAQTFQFLEKFVYTNVLRGLYEIGWTVPPLHSTFSEKELTKQLGITHGHFHQYLGFMCRILKEEGILEKDGTGTDWKVVQMPPSYEDVLAQLRKPEMSEELVSRFNSTLLLQKVAESLGSFLQGTLSPLPILFPSDSDGKTKDYPSIGDFYKDYLNELGAGNFDFAQQQLLRHICDTQTPESSFKLRVLEIGAGTGSFTKYVMNHFEALQIKFEYTYTDISVSFFPAAEQLFEKHLSSFRFKKLDIEEDPIAQGFIPEYFDFVFAGDVMHATRNIAESLQNIRVLMKPWARLVIHETTLINRILTFLFGTLDGYWRFQDFELRKDTCILEKNEWTQVLQFMGLPVEGIFSTFADRHSLIVSQKVSTPNTNRQEIEISNKSWIIFHLSQHPISERLLEKLANVGGRRVITVTNGMKFEKNVDTYCSYSIRKKRYEDFEMLFSSLSHEKVEIEGILYCWALQDNDQINTCREEVLQPYFNLTKSLLNTNFFNKKIDSTVPHLIVLTKGVTPQEECELSGFHASTLWGFTKSLKNENFHQPIKCVDIADQQIMDERRMQELFYELWNWSDKETQVVLSGHTRYVPKLISHKAQNNALELPPGTHKYKLLLPETKAIVDLQFGPLDSTNLGEDEVEVHLKTVGLNFRNILSIIKPTEAFKNSNAVGGDFAGVVKRVGNKVVRWKVGDRVCGCNFDPMPNHVLVSEHLLLPLPPWMSFCDGSTMPVVYMTSVLCLLDVAKINKGDTVLIHTASGGVGLSAIEICKHMGCTIIATAGSKRKRNYLRSLGIQNVFHSRNTQFGDQILELTKGEGVDVVLNSLTSEGFKEATLKACAFGARFIEMSKLNAWKEEQVKILRPDVQYTVVNLAHATKSESIKLFNIMTTLLQEKVMKPIPYVRFGALHIRQALEYMQKTKHIGKIVCVFPELKNNGGQRQICTPMFNENGTYLITGGMGIIGFTVCEWMLSKGAKHVVLVGRSAPSLKIETRINELNSLGGNVHTAQLDVGNFDQCEALLRNGLAKLKLPPLKGVMHAAGTLADGAIVNQNWEKLSSTFTTKINGTLNLHNLTIDLNLEHFVLFSSIASVFGTPFQSNHSAGNAFEDAFAHYRNSIGLPATSVNWGQWGEVGIAKEANFPGMKMLSNLQGVSGLEYVLQTQRVQMTIINMNSFLLLSKNLYLDARVWKAAGATARGSTISSSLITKSNEFWRLYDSLLEVEEKVALLKSQLTSVLLNTLKMEKTEIVQENTSLQELGVDSLMFIELKNGIQVLLGDKVKVSASDIKDCNTLAQLVTMLSQLINRGADELVGRPSMEQVKELIVQDSILPEHICPQNGQTVGAVCNIGTVLLTGCTGTLGPYILKELVQLPQIEKVICLIRPRKMESLDETLSKVLEGNDLHLDLSKIQCVAGNVAQFQLGMDPDVWTELSEKVDAIFHCAAAVQHTGEHYAARDSTTDMRAINVGGTKNLLEFACVGKLKRVYSASSLLAVLTVEDDGGLSERWPEAGEFDGITTWAYPITKYVGDVLTKKAAERGIPCKVFRFPFITGDSQTGRCSIEKNHLMLRYLFIMKSGIMPSLPMPLQMLPVDICAEASVRIFFQENVNNQEFSDIYNITHRHPDADQDFVTVAAKFGHTVKIVEYSQFIKQIVRSGNQDEVSPLGVFADFYSEDTLTIMYQNAPILRKWVEEGENSRVNWNSNKVSSFIPKFYEDQKSTMDYIYKDLCFCKEQGWFCNYGLE